MLKDNEGNKFSKGTVVGDSRQLQITIPASDWKHFPIGSRAKICPRKGALYILRTVISSGKRQRKITIPLDNWDMFQKRDKVKIYPIKQPNKQQEKKVQINEVINKQNAKQVHSPEQVSQS